MNASTRVRDVAVIGAGLSGLAAARRLHAAGRDVIVLEARDRVGGRTYSVDFGGARVDLGGQWIGPTQNRVRELVDELGIETFREHTAGRRVLDLGGTVRTFRGPVPRLPLSHTAEVALRLLQLSRLSRRIDPERPAAGRDASRWDAMSLAQWLDENVRTSGARALLEIATHMVFAAEPRELSFLYWLAYVRTGQGLVRLLDTEHGAQQTRFVRGAQEMSLQMAAELGDAVRLESPVQAIEQDDTGVVVHAGSHEERARLAIVAVPPAVCGRIRFAPALPNARVELHERMPMGSTIKAVVGYQTAFWHDAGLSGEALSDGAPVRATFDDTSADGTEPALVAFVVGDAARDASRLSVDERRVAVVGSLVRLFGSGAATPKRYVEKDWLADEWSGGCYTGLCGPGVLSSVGDALRAPIGRLHFAGTETATRWTGYFDGALTAGERAADEALDRLRSAG